MLNNFMSEKESIENIEPQVVELEPLPIKSGRGGVRPGAGRPKGSNNRISIDDMLVALKTHLGDDFHNILAQDFVTFRQEALMGGSKIEYVTLLKMFGDRLLPKQSIDITSNGETTPIINVTFPQLPND